MNARRVGVVLSACLVGALVLGCLPGGGGGVALFVDDGLGSGSGALDGAPGDACEDSTECGAGLRCLQRGLERLCVDTCDLDGACVEGTCRAALNDEAIGWCDLDDAGDEDDDSDILPRDDDPPGADDPDDPDPDEDDLDDDDDEDEDDAVSGGGRCGDAEVAAVVAAANASRREEGLSTLRCHEDLSDVAFNHSLDMVERDYFDHTSPEGKQPWDRMDDYGIEGYFTAGENIAWGYQTPADVHEGWMGSPGHRANILGQDYTHVGVGVVLDEDGAPVWTQLFAGF